MGVNDRWKRASSFVAFVALGVFLGMRVSPADPGPRLTAGPLDPRGFRAFSMEAETGSALRYNACEPIHYVVNPTNAPENGVEDIHRAFELTAEASGLRFVYDGETDEIPTDDRPSYQPDRYGDRWAPLLIGWTNGLPGLDTEPDPSGRRPVGVGGSRAELNDDGHFVYVTGSATFDYTATDLRSGFGGETWGQVMLHELGHVLGLAHVEDAADSVMNDEMQLRAAQWGSGDRAGLWSLGIGSPCLRTPPTP